MALNKSKNEILGQTKVLDDIYDYNNIDTHPSIAADPIVQYMNKDKLQKLLEETQNRMKKAAKSEDFMEAARLRDEMMEIGRMIKR